MYTSKEELMVKGLWDVYVEMYDVDPDVDWDESIFINNKHAELWGLI